MANFFIPMHECDPSVIHLSIHLENGQCVYFIVANVHQGALNPTGISVTAFFTLCQEDAFSGTLLYSEMPSYYTWNKTKGEFVRRRLEEPVNGQPGIFRKNTIGRLYIVHPNQVRLMFLSSHAVG